MFAHFADLDFISDSFVFILFEPVLLHGLDNHYLLSHTVGCSLDFALLSVL